VEDSKDILGFDLSGLLPKDYDALLKLAKDYKVLNMRIVDGGLVIKVMCMNERSLF
jgi:hypothetical protein